MSGPNWGEFKQNRAAPTDSPDVDFDEVCMRALTGAAGVQLIEALRARYIERTENPAAPEAVLRVRVAQQQMVRDLEAARDRGVEAVKRKAEAAKQST